MNVTLQQAEKVIAAAKEKALDIKSAYEYSSSRPGKQPCCFCPY